MNHFWLIQRGKINPTGGPQLISKQENGKQQLGVVELDHMGAAQFE